MAAIGYRVLGSFRRDYLEGCWSKIIVATRRYAKRQMTGFVGNACNGWMHHSKWSQPLTQDEVLLEEGIVMIIAIDGPAGAGKTSASKGVAASLDFVRRTCDVSGRGAGRKGGGRQPR